MKPSQPRLMVAPPRMNLRRTSSYSTIYESRSPASTTARFNFDHLIFSPPPSPRLPSLPQKRKRASSIKVLVSSPRRTIRFVVYIAGFIALFYFVSGFVQTRFGTPRLFDEYEMVAGDGLPDFPTPIIVGNGPKHTKWTVSIPHKYRFPLSMGEYAEMMDHCREASVRSRSTDMEMDQSLQKALSVSIAHDDKFVDIAEAEKTNLLPPTDRILTIEGKGRFIGARETIGKSVCQSSITYVLESTDAGLGQALMKMWTYYGLAKATGREFFLEDSNWGYGDYLDMFQAPPEPSCRPPPRHHMLPCPVDARHLVISNVNAKELLPILLERHIPIDKDDNPEKQIMELASVGYNALFRLNKDDQAYVDKRVQFFKQEAKSDELMTANAPIIGMHVRRGDRHPLEYQYKQTYIPAEVYLDRAHVLVDDHYNNSMWAAEETHRSITLIASDDPMVYREAAFAGSALAQDRIKLATKPPKADEDEDLDPIHPFIEETFGWEGGFYSPMFWNLGTERRNNAANAPTGAASYGVEAATSRPKPKKSTLQLRSYMGRAYMMDLAVLAGASDKVVCAVSAMGCRLLGVMLGWEEAIEEERWVNVDGDESWMGWDW